MTREEGSLHTKYRPQTFDEVIGNESVVTTVKALLDEGKVKTFLFTGQRGAGKTTMSRIIKNYVGCSDLDYVELNAANTRGIDTAREVIANSSLAPMGGKYRVYLFDECHQLTGATENALLKLLEEPPRSTYIILATTNPEKLLATTKSRCSSFQMKPLLRSEITKLINWVCEQEGLDPLWPGVIKEIIKVSDGSARTALTLLEKVIKLDNKEDALAVINADTDVEEGIALCRALANNDKWQSIAAILKGLNTEVESVRHQVLGYFSKVLLDKGDPMAAVIMAEFKEPFYNTGKPGLIHATFMAKAMISRKQ